MSTNTQTPKPLSGMRVIDFTAGIAGPHVGLLLAHQGADVIKVEPPEGDWSRVLGTHVDEFSPFSIYYNRGKRSLALDLKTAEGRTLARELALQADIVIESFRPGVMQSFGLDHESLRRDKPELIYLSMTGFGQEGPMAQLPATDTVIQGHSGLMSLNRDADGIPQRFPMILIDVVSGLYGFQAIMGAVVSHLRFGHGAYLDCTLLQSALALQAPALVKHCFEKGQPSVMYVPLGVLATRDSHLSISVNRDAHFVAFCRAIEQPELAHDPAYATLNARIANEQPLMALIRTVFKQRSTDEWVTRLQAEGILHARIRSYDEVLEDPSLQLTGMLDWMQHRGISPALPIPNIPVGPRASDYGELRECPRVGEHSLSILRELQVPESRIQSLLEKGAVLTQRKTASVGS